MMYRFQTLCVQYSEHLFHYIVQWLVMQNIDEINNHVINEVVEKSNSKEFIEEWDLNHHELEYIIWILKYTYFFYFWPSNTHIQNISQLY